MREYLGSKRDEVPCDSWHLRDLITKFRASDNLIAKLDSAAKWLKRNNTEYVGNPLLNIISDTEEAGWQYDDKT